MSQSLLPYQYEEELKESGLTCLAGLPLYLDLAHRMGLRESIESRIGGRSRGWTDSAIMLSIILLNLAGGDCVNDLRKLENDKGFCRLLNRVILHGLKRRERREIERRWRKEQKRSVPSPSATFRYLSLFHDEGQENLRQAGKAFIPAPNEYLSGLSLVCGDMVGFAQRHRPEETATLDMDATLIATNKSEALYSYKKFQAYQPLNVWWAEHELMLYTEFRDGNVPAGHEQLRVFQESLKLVPEGVKRIRLRSDTAGYQHELLRYCEMGENERFGRIEFAIGCDVTKEFKRAVAEASEEDWQPIYKEINGQLEKTDRTWAEVCFVPSAIGHSKKGPSYRYVATRELVRQGTLPSLEDAVSLPFPTVSMSRQQYKVHGVVTNMDLEGSKLINWLYERCGKSEEAHSVLKEDLAGGKLPSGDFGSNAAWWWMSILAFNLNSIMKRLVLGKEWIGKRMKAIRFHFINLAGRVFKHARQLIVRVSHGHPSVRLLMEAREKIFDLVPAGTG